MSTAKAGRFTVVGPAEGGNSGKDQGAGGVEEGTGGGWVVMYGRGCWGRELYGQVVRRVGRCQVGLAASEVGDERSLGR